MLKWRFEQKCGSRKYAVLSYNIRLSSGRKVDTDFRLLGGWLRPLPHQSKAPSAPSHSRARTARAARLHQRRPCLVRQDRTPTKPIQFHAHDHPRNLLSEPVTRTATPSQIDDFDSALAIFLHHLLDPLLEGHPATGGFRPLQAVRLHFEGHRPFAELPDMLVIGGGKGML